MHLIKNNYFVVDNKYGDEFHIAIYYLASNKCKIVIRRLDAIGWGQDLNIKIMDIDGIKYERISLGSSVENLKIFEFYTNVLLHKLESGEDQLIPKCIIQCSNEPMNKSLLHYNSILTFVDLNPDYEYKYFNDVECRAFIKENYEEYVVKAYDLIYDDALKTKFFKYAYLYIKGGCYFQSGMVLQTSLANIIRPTDKLIIYDEMILCIEKNNEFLKESLLKYIDDIKYKCDNDKQNSKIGINSIVGESVLQYKNNGIYFNGSDKMLLKRDNRENIDSKKNISYYFKKIGEENNYTFYLYPIDNFNINVNINFKITWIFENLYLIKRIDNNSGWNNMVKLKIINEKDGYILCHDIGSSELNEKQFIFN